MHEYPLGSDRRLDFLSSWKEYSLILSKVILCKRYNHGPKTMPGHWERQDLVLYGSSSRVSPAICWILQCSAVWEFYPLISEQKILRGRLFTEKNEPFPYMNHEPNNDAWAFLLNYREISFWQHRNFQAKIVGQARSLGSMDLVLCGGYWRLGGWGLKYDSWTRNNPWQAPFMLIAFVVYRVRHSSRQQSLKPIQSCNKGWRTKTPV